jgi:hypothetical protein
MAQQMPESSSPDVGDKGRDPEEEEKGVDPQNLIGRFRSKRDIFDYLILPR